MEAFVLFGGFFAIAVWGFLGIKWLGHFQIKYLRPYWDDKEDPKAVQISVGKQRNVSNTAVLKPIPSVKENTEPTAS